MTETADILWSDTTVALLAGGESSRFGSRKEKALWQGQSLIERTALLARQLSSQILFIGRSDLNPMPDLMSNHQDRFTGNGPLGGIDAALYHSNTPYTATLPCDMPMLTASVYHTLYNFRSPEHPVVAVSHTGLEPLLCIWPASVMSYIEHRLLAGRNGPIPILEDLKARQIYLPDIMADYDERCIININTRHDLEQHQRQAT